MGTGEADSSSEESEGESDDSDDSEDELRAKATARINKEVNSSESSGSDEEGSASENEFVMNFADKPDSKKKSKKADAGNAIMNLKFMKNAEKRKKEMLKNQVQYTTGQIKSKDDYDNMEEEENFINSKNKFGKK